MPDLEHAERLGILDAVDERRAGVDARVGRVEAAGVGEQDEQVRAGQHRHLGGEEVVVAEADLVGGGRVVLVDDRDDPPVEQLAQRAARVDVVGARAHVEERQQHLRGGQPAVAQQLVVDAVELALADRARRLQVLDRARADRELQQPHAAGDRAGGDDHHVDPLGVQRGDLVADALEHAGAQVAGRLGDDGGSELDDEGGHGGLQVRSSQDRYMRRGAARCAVRACSRTTLLTLAIAAAGGRPGRRPRPRPEPQEPRDPPRGRDLARAVPGRAEHRARARARLRPAGRRLLRAPRRAARQPTRDAGQRLRLEGQLALVPAAGLPGQAEGLRHPDPARDQPARPRRADPVRDRQRGHAGALPDRRRLRHRVVPHRPQGHAVVRRRVRSRSCSTPTPPARCSRRRSRCPASARRTIRACRPARTTSPPPTASRAWRSRPTGARCTRRSRARSPTTTDKTIRRSYTFDIDKRRYEKGYRVYKVADPSLPRLRPHRARLQALRLARA